MWSLIPRLLRLKVATEPPRRLLEPAPPAFRGAPVVDSARCGGCGECVRQCPSGALGLIPGADGAATWSLDRGLCLFCGTCAEVCPRGAITQSRAFALATRDREDLRVTAAVRVEGCNHA